MLKNYLKIALRNLMGKKASSLIKIVSLTVGMMCFAIIALFVHYELDYDRIHENPEDVYRVVKDFVNDDGSRIPDATTPPALASALMKDLPGVSAATRIFPSWGQKFLIKYGQERFYEERVVRIDKNFFDIFSFPFVKGGKKISLTDPNFILLTQSAADKIFGSEDPLGKVIRMNNSDYTVTGVLADVSEQSHFTFDYLISVRSLNYDQLETEWGWYNFYTYVRLKPGFNPQNFEEKLQPLYERYNPESNNQYYAQALTEIHLKSHLKWELGTNGDITYIRILFIIAIFVLLLAMINYINLVTAQSAIRAKEVGIRKVSGATEGLLIRQFLTESVILSIAATLISVALVEAILPFFKDLLNTSLSFFSSQGQIVLWILIGVGLMTGVLAGLYPAFYLSSFKPANVLKGTIMQGTAGTFLRKSLVTFQFVISTVLIIGTLVISGQIDYISNKKLGFNKENVLIINNAGDIENQQALLSEIKNLSGVVNAGSANGILGGQNWTTTLQTTEGENSLLLNFVLVDYDFLNVMGVTFKEGRNFSREFGTDTLAVIINETAAEQLGLEEPVVASRVIIGYDEEENPIFGNVIGLIKDFHFTTFHEAIKPFGFFLDVPDINTLFVRTESANLSATIASVKQTWGKFEPQRPFNFTFQDEQVAKLYSREQRFKKLFSYFTILAIVIACLGLFGLSSHTARQRQKEIGIRKVLGATVANIIGLLSKDFLKLVLLGLVIAIPIAWYTMNLWLADFAYRIDIGIGIFLLAGGLALLIALATVSWQSIRTALANPVDSLRSE